ncbi:AAA family ATPase [Mycobacterium marinum]|uniref:AAA family ATPase n=1 Tax=Mycobacterium marinum TaxID=1781 RepID=UPI001379F884|nr:AAA family ATPase [Mycobacterium marinum]
MTAADASTAHDTPITAARMDYDSAVAAGSHTVEELDVLRALADEADAEIAELITAPTEPWNPTPTTLPTWFPFIPEDIAAGFVAGFVAPAEGGACMCPNNGALALHIDGCGQGVGGKAQPFTEAFCAAYDLTPNRLIDAVELGCALRGMRPIPGNADALRDLMTLEAEDREFAAHAAKSAYEGGVAEGESEAEALFETLRKRLPVEQYDAVLDGLELGDADAVLERLRAEVAALPAPFTVPPAPGATVPTAPAAPLPPVAPAEPLSPEQRLVADAMTEREVEQNALHVTLAPYLTMLPPDGRGIEVTAAMSMTRADRTEAVDAALSGLLSRRGLTLAELAPTSRSVRSAWERLREPEVSGDRYVDGGSFIHDIPDVTPAVWGTGSDVLWAEGEDLIIAGPQGVGKSTIAGLLVQAMIEGGEVLDYPVKRVDKVLYLAMDRPQQIARALRRQLKHLDREFIAQHLKVWKGPPPEDLAKFPDRLLAMAIKAGAEVVVVDSLKDAALGLSSDEVGAGWNRARQTLLAAGIQLLSLHHDRKANDTTAPAVEKIYGSIWITGGAGSIIHLDGEPGDPIVRLTQVKKPDAEVGPYILSVDNSAGTISIFEEVDLVTMAGQPGGVTASAAAAALFESDKPSRAQKEKARRRLEKLREQGLLAAVTVGGATAYTAATGLTVVEPPGASPA